MEAYVGLEQLISIGFDRWDLTISYRIISAMVLGLLFSKAVSTRRISLVCSIGSVKSDASPFFQKIVYGYVRLRVCEQSSSKMTQ